MSHLAIREAITQMPVFDSLLFDRYDLIFMSIVDFIADLVFVLFHGFKDFPLVVLKPYCAPHAQGSFRSLKH